MKIHNKQNLNDYEYIKKTLIDIANELGYIPTYQELRDMKTIPDPNEILTLFRTYENMSFNDFLSRMGFKKKPHSKKVQYDFEALCSILEVVSRNLKRIPTKEEITRNPSLPNPSTLRKVFKQHGYNSYTQYLKNKGFKSLMDKNRPRALDFDDLCEIWEKYYGDNGFYPNSLTCYDDKSLPSWTTVKEVCGQNYAEFCDKYGLSKMIKNKDYNEYCTILIEKCNALGRTLTHTELKKYDLPGSRWFVVNCPNKKVKNYNDFLNYINLKPYYSVSKEYAIEAIRNKVDKLKRPLKGSDFKNPSYNEIGLSTIVNHWGSFNNMLRDLGLPIGREYLAARHKDIEELKEDINRLCAYVYNKEGRKIIMRDDVRECSWCLSPQTYDRWFKQEINMTLGDYIEHIGYIPNKSGMGMIHKYDDGEITTSKFEFKLSNYLRKNNIKYERNVKYSLFIDNYKGNKDCDYVIKLNDKLLYVEIAGMLDETKINKNKDDKIRAKYRLHITEKEKMLKESNLNYQIIYPKDFYENDESKLIKINT